MNDRLIVKLNSVDKHFSPIECDSVRIPVSDSIKGEFSGSYGIKKGHAKAVFSLKKGEVVVLAGGKTIFSAELSDGFAMVENNVISITVDKITNET